MKKENNEVIEATEVEEVMETENKQKFGSKIVGFGKKHGKKIVTGIAVAAVGLLGYALGQKKAADEGDDYFDEEVDFETDVTDFDEENMPE